MGGRLPKVRKVYLSLAYRAGGFLKCGLSVIRTVRTGGHGPSRFAHRYLSAVDLCALYLILRIDADLLRKNSRNFAAFAFRRCRMQTGG